MKPPRSKAWLWAAPSVLLLVVLLLWPVIYLIRMSLHEGGNRSGFGIGASTYTPGTWTLDVYRKLGSDQYFWDILGFTVWLGFVVAVLCILLAWPAAQFLWHMPRRWKPLALACVIIPKLSNLLVTVYGLMIILGDHGPLNDMLMAWGIIKEPLALQNNATGVVIGKTLLILPYTILLIWAGLERLDRNLLAAARGLGAGTWQTLVRVTLPLSLPALTTAALVSLIWALGAFISPSLLGSPEEITLAVDVQHQMFQNMHWPRGAGEGVAMLVTLIIIAGGFSFVRPRSHPPVR